MVDRFKRKSPQRQRRFPPLVRGARGDRSFAKLEIVQSARRYKWPTFPAEESAAAADAADADAAAIRFDYELLLKLTQQNQWDDDTPVSVDLLGPLWPFGKPKDWPEDDERCVQQDLEIEIEVPDGASEEEIKAQIVELSQHASDLHRAYGGSGLQVKSITVWDEALVPAGAPE